MRAKLKALGRLAALYEVLEHANGISLDQARASLREVEARIIDRQDAAMRLEVSSHEALEAGDIQNWLLDRSQIEFAQWNAEALEQLRIKSDTAMREAADVYQASRMQLEQLESVLNEVRSSLVLENERAEQRAADDRYLSRQRWKQHNDRRP